MLQSPSCGGYRSEPAPIRHVGWLRQPGWSLVLNAPHESLFPLGVHGHSQILSWSVEMVQALLRGIIAVALGLGITYVITLARPTPWSLSEILAAVGVASFCASFFTALATRRPSSHVASEK